MSKRTGGKSTPLGEPVEFAVSPDPLSKLTPEQFAGIGRFQKDVKAAQRELVATNGTAGELASKIEAMRKANKLAPTPDEAVETELVKLAETVRVVRRGLQGDQVLAARNENVPTSTSERLGYAASAGGDAVAVPTGTAKAALADATAELADAGKELRPIAEKGLPELEKKLDALGAPWTPGRLPKGK